MEKTSVTIYVTVAWFYLLARKQAELIPLVTWYVCVYCLSASCFFFFIIVLLMDCLVQMLLSRHLNPVFATGAFVIPTSLYFLLKVITDAILMFSLAC